MTLDQEPTFTKIKYLKSKGSIRIDYEVGPDEHTSKLQFPPADLVEALQLLTTQFGEVMGFTDEYCRDLTVLGVSLRDSESGRDLKVWVQKPVLDERTALLSTPYAPAQTTAVANAVEKLTKEAWLALEGKRAQRDLFKARLDDDLDDSTEDIALEGKQGMNEN